jgi:hypothetical protein
MSAGHPMPLPSHCPNCHASLPESLERFGTNTACKACGQILRNDEPLPTEVRRPTSLPQPTDDDDHYDSEDAGELPPFDQLLSEGWGYFRENLGLCVGVSTLALLLNLVAQSPELAWTHYFQARAANPIDRNLIDLLVNVYILFRLVFSIWIGIGLHQFMLKIVRDQHAGVGDLFRGGEFLGRAITCTLILVLASFALMFLTAIVPGAVLSQGLGQPLGLTLGFMLSIFPITILLLMFSQFVYILIDHSPPGLDSLWESTKLTHGKKLSLFMLFLICAIINLFGCLAVLVGILFTSPFTSIVMALAYDHICIRPRGRASREEDE